MNALLILKISSQPALAPASPPMRQACGSSMSARLGCRLRYRSGQLPEADIVDWSFQRILTQTRGAITPEQPFSQHSRSLQRMQTRSTGRTCTSPDISASPAFPTSSPIAAELPPPPAQLSSKHSSICRSSNALFLERLVRRDICCTSSSV